MQAASGIDGFCKTIIMLRALLTEHALAPVLGVLLDHINFEEFVMAGMLLVHPFPTLPAQSCLEQLI